MTITSTNRTSIGYIEETTAGSTPSTPTFQLLPTTGGTPMSETETEVSEVIRDDRMIDDLIPVNENIGGELEYELSYTAYKPMITSLLRTSPASAVAVSESDIAVAAAGRTYTTSGGDFVSDGVVAGMFLLVAGFTETANNGVKLVESVTTTVITVSDANLVDEAAGDAVTMDNDAHVLNGESNEDSYSFVKRVQGISSTAYFYFTGMQINSMSFNVEVGSRITGTLGLMGLGESITETEIAGSSYTDAAAYTILNAVSSVSFITISGISDATNYQSLSFTVNNNIEGAKAIGTLGAVDLAAFTCEVTGEINIYFESKAIYDSYKNATSFDLSLVLVDGDSNYIGIHMPKCKFETLETPIDGKDSFFMARGTFRALRDSDQDKQISFTFMT